MKIIGLLAVQLDPSFPEFSQKRLFQMRTHNNEAIRGFLL